MASYIDIDECAYARLQALQLMVGLATNSVQEPTDSPYFLFVACTGHSWHCLVYGLHVVRRYLHSCPCMHS
jgi:hypothetical protein